MKILSQVQLSGEEIGRLKEAGEGLEVVVATKTEDAMKEIADSDIFFGRIPKQVFLTAKKLQWIQVFGAGVDTQIFPELIDSDVILTSTSGAFNYTMADHTFALILAISRGIAFFVRNQTKKIWDRSMVLHQLAGQTLGIIGLGNIGREIGRRGKAFGMTVVAADAKLTECPDFVDKLCHSEKMDEVLEQADYLVVVVPLTEETRGMIGAKEISKMKPSACLINVGRGPVVDETALINALKNGVIAGAGLDVFEKEPLPADSELWNMENVVMTPHIGGPSPDTWKLSFEIFLDNLGRFAAGQPLRNVINKKLGY